MNGLAPCQAEVEQQRLFELNTLATKRLFLDDGKCLYCGIRARVRNLCVLCEGRREMLAARYPGSSVKRVQEKISGGMTKLGDVKRPAYRPPHNSE